MVEQIEEEMKLHENDTVDAVHVRIGVLSGVDAEALRFAFELACEGSELAGSRLEVESIGLLVHCPQCAVTHRPDPLRMFCPRCITPEQTILEGRELEIRALELTS